jgi:hypothetical protein
MARAYTRHDWTKLDPLIDRLVREEGYTIEQACQELGIKISTYRMHQRTRAPSTPSAHQSTPSPGTDTSDDQDTLEHHGTRDDPHASEAHPSTPMEHPDAPESLDGPTDASELIGAAHLSTPEGTDLTEVHQSIPEHPGTLEGYQEVMEDVQESVPETPHITTEEEYPSTPEVHQEMSLDDSTMEHSGVPARQDHHLDTPLVHPGTPTEEDWMLWTTMKTRWTEIEKLLADWQTRHTLLRTPSGTPRHTMKKTYVVDSLYVELIDRYAQEQGVELKDVVNLAFHEFFERREFLPQERKTP